MVHFKCSDKIYYGNRLLLIVLLIPMIFLGSYAYGLNTSRLDKLILERIHPVVPVSPCVETYYSADGNSVIYVYFCDGVFTMPEDYDDVEVLIVAGGGGGGLGASGGGGGGGELLYRSSMMLSRGASYQVTVGKGGNGAGNLLETGTNGDDSGFNGLVAVGGGGGGTVSLVSVIANGKVGGNGGGGAAGPGLSFNGGNGNAPSHSNAGGNGHQSGASNNRAGGGGGGAGGLGNSAGNGHNPGLGGLGRQIDMFSEFPLVTIGNVFAAGGGATGRKNNGDRQESEGGSGIGGNGNADGEGGSGKENTGSGGGAGLLKGGKGADGVVVVKLGAKILPVVWAEVNAELIEDRKGVKLGWTLSREEKVSHYEVERSVNGIQSFKKIGDLSPLAGESLEYKYLDDELPDIEGRVYYRIKQVDLNGAYQYSKTLMVDLPEAKLSKGVWKVYPNPTRGEKVNIILAKKDKYNGGEIRFRFFNTLNATGYFEAHSLTELNDKVADKMTEFAGDLVVVELRWDELVEYVKIIKK